MKNFFEFAVLAVLACACDGSLLEPFSENVDVAGVETLLGHEMMVLGAKLEDPYTVANMTKALASVYPTKADRVSVPTTDYYVRFLPTGGKQLEVLEKKGLHLVDYPVDYEIIKDGDYYHDPEIEDGRITWQYAVVKKDFEFPVGIRYEILDDCYLPENDTQTKAADIDWDMVEKESYRLTGNEKLIETATKGGTAGTPKGRITIVDDKLGQTPAGVKGVRVSVNSFVKFDHAFTDDDGNYEMSKSFSSSVRYRLVFKNKKGFGIGFNLLLVPASTSALGKAPATGLDVMIDKSSNRKLFSRCVVNNAGYEYYDSCTKNGVSMKTPPSNLRIWLFQNLGPSSSVMMQQGAFIDNGLIGRYLGEYTALVKIFLPDITLGLKGKEDYNEIYAAAIHEMAHASHFMQAGKEYWDKYIEFILSSYVTSGFVTYGIGTEVNHGYCEVGEMWAYYIQTKMYQERYGENVVFGTSYWFSPQILLNLDDRGIDRFKIFNAMTHDITDRDLFQKKLTSLYPESKSIINQAFGRYN